MCECEGHHVKQNNPHRKTVMISRRLKPASQTHPGMGKMALPVNSTGFSLGSKKPTEETRQMSDSRDTRPQGKACVSVWCVTDTALHRFAGLLHGTVEEN